MDHPSFDLACPWPRRLLNVSNMTLYKWEPGNTYCGVSSPSYAVLSYTWGRWRIKDKESKVESLDIRGIP